MHIDKPTLLVVGGEPAFHAVIREAASRAFDAPTVVVTADSLDEVSRRTVPPQADLLVLIGLDALEEERTLQMAGLESGECPVVRLGSVSQGREMETLPLEDLNAPLLAHVFRSALVQHALLRDVARAKGDLLTMGRRISHDLRTPLGGVFTSVEVLQEVLADGGPAGAEFLQPVSDSAQDMADLIDRVSFLIRASVSPYSPAQVAMDEPVMAALEKLEPKIRRQGASVTQPSTWPTLAGVASWLEVVWGNLVANALQHGGPSPQICLGWERSGTECHFWVRDNGPGVAVEKRGRLFQPFHQLHEPGSARGLGLSIVQRLVELQSGRCRYEPLPSGGASFCFTLPAMPTP